jgi:hypothetical protein
MSSIQYQLDKHYREMFNIKAEQYYRETKCIAEHRAKLRDIFIPKYIIKGGIPDVVYPEAFYEADDYLDKLQQIVWDRIFKEVKLERNS